MKVKKEIAQLKKEINQLHAKVDGLMILHKGLLNMIIGIMVENKIKLMMEDLKND